MNNFPEPFSLGALCGIAFDELAIALPCFEVKYSGAANELLKLLRFEELIHECFITDSVESFFERFQFISALRNEGVLDIKVHILLSVVLVHKDA